MKRSIFGLSLLGGVIVGTSSGWAQTTPFAQNMVDGIEVAVGGKTRVTTPPFLSSDSLCGVYYMQEGSISQLGKNFLAALNGTGMLPDGAQIVRQEVHMSQRCSGSATLLPGQLNIVVELPGNLAFFNVTTPTPLGQGQDPRFSVDFDIRASAQVMLSATAKSGLTLGKVDVKFSNIHPDSQNLTGDVVLAGIDVIQMVLDRNLLGALSKDQYFSFDGVRVDLPKLCPIVGEGCEQFKLTSSFAPGGTLRIDLDGPPMAEIVANNPALVTNMGNLGSIADAVPAGISIADRVAEPGSCKADFVPRAAGPADLVCVTAESRGRVVLENVAPEARWVADGAYGPHTCIPGLVWREAFESDTICVTPEIKAVVGEENRLAADRRVGG